MKNCDKGKGTRKEGKWHSRDLWETELLKDSFSEDENKLANLS